MNKEFEDLKNRFARNTYLDLRSNGYSHSSAITVVKEKLSRKGISIKNVPEADR